MIELSRADFGAGEARIGFAGDTLNTAVYLLPLGPEVSDLTVVGVDGFSIQMLEMFAREGLDSTLIPRHPTRLPGLYGIEVDREGERSFRYWRGNSAARAPFSESVPRLSDLDAFKLIYLSGITLAILPEDVRRRQTEKLGDLKAKGCMVAFDSNSRQRLWPDPDAAGEASDAMWRATTIALPSLDDDTTLQPVVTEADVLGRLEALGLREMVLKRGAAGPVLRIGKSVLRPLLPKASEVIETTRAEDSFDAGYLAARLAGFTPEASAQQGHALASCVIAHPGAIIPRAGMPK